MLFTDKTTVYLGSSEAEFQKTRSILEQHDIKYQQHIISHDDAMISPGRGTGRSISGINSSLESGKMYEITVSKKDAETAKMYLAKKQ